VGAGAWGQARGGSQLRFNLNKEKEKKEKKDLRSGLFPLKGSIRQRWWFPEEGETGKNC
jgi:hypothetical protein